MGGAIVGVSSSKCASATGCCSPGIASASTPIGPRSRNQSGISTGSMGSAITSDPSASSTAEARSCANQSASSPVPTSSVTSSACRCSSTAEARSRANQLSASSPAPTSSVTSSACRCSSTAEARSRANQLSAPSRVPTSSVTSSTCCSLSPSSGIVGRESPLIGTCSGSTPSEGKTAIGMRRALHRSQ